MTMTNDPFVSSDSAVPVPDSPPAGFEGSQAEWNTRVDLAACTGSSPITAGTT